MVVFWQKWLFSGKNDCIREKEAVFGQGGFILAKWLSSGKSGIVRAKVVVFGKLVIFE